MNAVNAVLVFALLWTFSAVCRADDDDCSVSCDDVTGTVGEEVTFICRVPQHCDNCSIKNHTFKHPESYKDSMTCNQELPNNFTCSFTPTTEMNEKLKFFVQTQCGVYYPTSSVNITGLRKADKPEDAESEDSGSNSALIIPVVGSSIILIITLMTIICKKQKAKYSHFRASNTVMPTVIVQKM